MVPMEVSGVYTSAKSAYPQVVLKQKDGSAYLPIVIGRFEAAAISLARAQRQPPRPISYDLARSILAAVGAEVLKVEITDLHEGTYYAEVHLRGPDGTIAVMDSRPSDAIALALRSGAAIYASPAVLKEAGYLRPESPEEPQDGAMETPQGSYAESAAARERADAAEPVGGTGAERQAQLEEKQEQAPVVDPVEALRRRLEQAVAEEVYEEAARLRDEIHRLEQEADS